MQQVGTETSFASINKHSSCCHPGCSLTCLLQYIVASELLQLKIRGTWVLSSGLHGRYIRTYGFSLMQWYFIQEYGKGGSSTSRCDLKQNLLNGGCSSTAVEFPSSTLSIQENKPLSDKALGTADDVTQIKPQKIHMALRPGTFTPNKTSPLRLVANNHDQIYALDTRHQGTLLLLLCMH